MTIQKITNLKLTKPDDFEEREWSEVLSRKNRLLAITDWTQSVDCNLLPSNKFEWMIWRDKLRSIKKASHSDKLLAKQDIDNLEKSRPNNKFKKESNKFKIDFHYLDITSLTTAKQSLIDYKILQNNKQLVEIIGMNQLSFMILYQETLDFKVESAILEDYPILYTFFINSDFTEIDLYIENILNVYKSMRRFIIESEMSLIKFKQELEKCATLDDIGQILDDLNGYNYNL